MSRAGGIIEFVSTYRTRWVGGLAIGNGLGVALHSANAGVPVEMPWVLISAGYLVLWVACLIFDLIEGR